MKYCPKCGTGLNNDQRECWNCGTALDTGTQSSRSIPVWPLALSIIFLVCSFVTLLIAGCNNTNNRLQGTWQNDNYTYTFNKNGTGEFVSVWKGTNMETKETSEFVTQSTFGYEINGNIMIITYQSGKEEKIKIIIDGDSLELIFKNGTVVDLIRVSTLSS